MKKFYIRKKILARERRKENEKKGLRYVTFLWPEKEYNIYAEQMLKTGVKPNEFIWSMIVKSMIVKSMKKEEQNAD